MNQRVDPRLLHLGVPEMDADHEKLVALANKIAGVVDSEKFRERSLASEFRALKDYTQQHFAREEAYMESIGYPGREAHRKLHQEMIAELDKMSDAGRVTKGAKFALSLRLFMQVWLFEHISKHDAAYAEYGRKKAA